MRALLSLVLAFSVSVSVLLLSGGGVADAAFHCVRIHAVAGSWNGDTNIQYVELRMDLGGQNVLTGHTIQFFSASGQLKATFTFPSGVTNALVGDSILSRRRSSTTTRPAARRTSRSRPHRTRERIRSARTSATRCTRYSKTTARWCGLVRRSRA